MHRTNVRCYTIETVGQWSLALHTLHGYFYTYISSTTPLLSEILSLLRNTAFHILFGTPYTILVVPTSFQRTEFFIRSTLNLSFLRLPVTETPKAAFLSTRLINFVQNPFQISQIFWFRFHQELNIFYAAVDPNKYNFMTRMYYSRRVGHSSGMNEANFIFVIWIKIKSPTHFAYYILRQAG